MITLFCHVYGESITNVFSVKINPQDTVDDLKELIKKKKSPEFDNIAADRLVLWKVNIPVDDAEATLKDFVLTDNVERALKLWPTDEIDEVFAPPLKKHIHVIVERPLCTEVKRLRAELIALQAKTLESSHDFDLLVGRRRTAFPWSANLNTVTIRSLQNALFKQFDFGKEFGIDDTTLAFTICDTKEKHEPIDDNAFRDMLRRMADKNTRRISVHILTPSKPFSSYSLNAVLKLYGLGDGGDDASLQMFPVLECGKISGDIYERKLTDLMTCLEERLPIMPFDGTNEATKSIYVYFFLHAAVSIFGTSAFTICLEKSISGIHGHGSVDFAIDSCRTLRTVGVTEVKNEDFKAGIAQNAVQLEACLNTRKRKADEMDGYELVDEKTFGIVSDAEKFYFTECQINGDGKASFKLSKPVLVNYGTEVMKETVAIVLSHIGWLLEEAEKSETPPVPIKKPRVV